MKVWTIRGDFIPIGNHRSEVRVSPESNEDASAFGISMRTIELAMGDMVVHCRIMVVRTTTTDHSTHAY